MIAPMSSAIELAEFAEQGTIVFPLTVDQYHRMIKTGILEEGAPYELLDGVLVRKDRSAAGEDPMTVGHEHAWVVSKLTALSAKFKRLGCHIRIQSPVTLPPHREPEPDGAVVIGTEDDFLDHHPGAEDVPCVIEVADASLRRDRTTKLRTYAAAGIGHYLIVNLPDRVIEAYTEPLTRKGRYGRSVTLSRRQNVEIPAARGKRLSVAVRTLVP